MTNICQAIEEELRNIQFVEDSGEDIYKTMKSGMSLALWREILSNPETMRIEASMDFIEPSMNLLDNILEENNYDDYFDNIHMIEGPVILYIPDFKKLDNQANASNGELLDVDGVLVLHWLEKDFEINGAIHHAWVQAVTKNFISIPMSVEDVSEDSFIEKYLRRDATNKDSLKEFQIYYRQLHYALASVIYMMKKPNFATQTIVSNSRGVRKRLEKKKGIPRERWSRIQWNVGQNVQREVRKTMGEEHCTALHRVRGFYRKAESHYNNVTKIEGNWFQWIKPFWRGHPAFGIIKSTYAPKIEDIKLQ